MSRHICSADLLQDLKQLVLEILFFDARHNQKKFITAIANQHICLSGTVLDNIDESNQHNITGIMAK